MPPQPTPNVLLTVSCPDTLPAVTDPSVGALVRGLIDTAEVYHSCRAAALASP